MRGVRSGLLRQNIVLSVHIDEYLHIGTTSIELGVPVPSNNRDIDGLKTPTPSLLEPGTPLVKDSSIHRKSWAGL